MGQFDKFRDQYEPTEDVWYALPFEPMKKGEPRPELLVVYAGASNRAYTNKLGARSAKKRGSRKRAGGVDQRTVVEALDAEREDYAGPVVKGWRYVFDGNTGVPIPFTVAACLEYLRAFPDWAFIDLNQFCGGATNFLPEGAPDDDDFDEQAGK